MKLINQLSSFPVLALVVSLMQIAPGISQAQKPRTTSAANNTFFKTWRDPREDAFRIGVPVRWRVSGGTVRLGPADVRQVVRAQSPDGIIRVFIDDPDLRIH